MVGRVRIGGESENWWGEWQNNLGFLEGLKLHDSILLLIIIDLRRLMSLDAKGPSNRIFFKNAIYKGKEL